MGAFVKNLEDLLTNNLCQLIVIEKVEEYLSEKQKKEKPNRQYSLKDLSFKELEQLLGTAIFFDKKLVKNILRKVISLYLDPKYIHDKTFQKRKEFDEVKDFKNVKLAIRYVESISRKPAPKDFKPHMKLYFDKKAKKPIVLATIYGSTYDVYENYENILILENFEIEETPNGFVGLVGYSLYRGYLRYWGRHKKFAFLFEYENGAVFVKRIPLMSSIEEALNWLKQKKKNLQKEKLKSK